MPKILKPTLRERNRYLAFALQSERSFERKPIVDAIWSSLLRLYGEVGASKSSLLVMDWDTAGKRGIMKVNHRSVGVMRDSVALVKEIEGFRAAIHVIKTCGTLRKAREITGIGQTAKTGKN